MPSTTAQQERQTIQSRKRIGVFALERAPGVQALLQALEDVLAVRFERTDRSAEQELDGALVLDQERLQDVPQAIPRLLLARGAPRPGEVQVSLADGAGLPRPLHGMVIAEQALPQAPQLPGPEPGRVLATIGSNPVWWQSAAGAGSLSACAYPLAELGAQEALREHLRPGCFMGMLPLLQFVGELLGEQGWSAPALRAAFVIDDPNLHWPSYGYLNYRELALHAREHHYHVALATVPLDGWLVNPKAAALLEQNSSELSLLMHGNDHVARELGRLGSDAQAQRAISQALVRIASLERRAHLSVDRVMAPPHGACSERALEAMFRLGIQAACISRPYPWHPDDTPPPTPLAGWYPAEMVAGGIPVLPRYKIARSRVELAFRALLGQPLIVYGHHGDFADGLDLFAQAADDINRLGEVSWGALSSIARANYATRKFGESLQVRMHSRQIALEVPAGIRTVQIIIQEPLGGAGWHQLSYPGGRLEMTFADGLGISEPLAVDGPVALELALLAERPLDPTHASVRSVRPWPWVRRALVEGRDRIQPHL